MIFSNFGQKSGGHMFEIMRKAKTSWKLILHFTVFANNFCQIKKLIMYNDFIGETLYFVEQAKLSSTSVVILIRPQLYVSILFLGSVFSYCLILVIPYEQ